MKSQFIKFGLPFLFCIFCDYSFAKSKINHDKYFACTRSNNINLRNGPGENYILIKNINQSNLPVFVKHEIEDWVNIRLSNSTEGWVYKPLLKINKSCKTIAMENSLLHKDKEDNSDIIYTFHRSEFVKISKCKENMCKIKFNKHTGWIEKSKLWGIYKK